MTGRKTTKLKKKNTALAANQRMIFVHSLKTLLPHLNLRTITTRARRSSARRQRQPPIGNHRAARNGH
jgi:hypothetical protein